MTSTTAAADQTPPSLIPSFPPLSHESVLAFQFSLWYPRFAAISIKSTIIRSLSEAFRDYLNADGVFVPTGSENAPARSSLSDGESDDDEQHHGSLSEDDEDDDSVSFCDYAFPEIDTEIRRAIVEYGAVFPKLNFSSPRDAAWVLPAGQPLKCHSPADVYLLLKSSDFICHDLDPVSVFEGCESGSPTGSSPPYDLELVLRKWYAFDPSRELRCFVRNGVLIGICQRDNIFYEFWNELGLKDSVKEGVKTFWRENIRDVWQSSGPLDYVFDILLTRDLKRAHIIDFNPYAPRTDSLLFSYDELAQLRSLEEGGDASLPEFRVIDSQAHPAALRNAPTHQHNMVPFEALHLSDGRSIEEFAKRWKDEIQKSRA